MCNPPVGERPNEGISEELHSGFGGKEESHFDIFIEELFVSFGAVWHGGVIGCGRGHGCGQSLWSWSGEQANTTGLIRRVVIKWHYRLERVSRGKGYSGGGTCVLGACLIIHCVKVAGDDGH